MIPILINTSEPMVKVRVVTVKDYSSKTLSLLQNLGVLHVEEASELTAIDKAVIDNRRNDVRKALATCEAILANLTGERTIRLAETTDRESFEAILRDVKKIYADVSHLIQKQDRLQEEITTLEFLAARLRVLLREVDVPMSDLTYSGRYLFTAVLVMTDDMYKTFGERARAYLLEEVAVSEGGETVLYIIARSDDRQPIEMIIREMGITLLAPPANDSMLGDFLIQNKETLQKKKEEFDSLRRELQKAIEGDLHRIALYREILSMEDDHLSVLQQASEAHYVTLIEGFVPESQVDLVGSGLRELVNYIYIETKHPVPAETPPTKLRNPRGIKPFEVIVSLFSLPRYGDWDPTPSVAYFFAFFFGLMLNDLVYAAGLLVLARFLLDKLVEDPESEGTQLFRHVLYISGSVALVMGILSGTYLGDFFTMYFSVDIQKLALSAAIQTKLSDPISFIILSLIIGLIHLNIAHVLGMIKGIKENDKGMVVSKIGLFLTQIFGIPYLFKAMLNITLFPLSETTYGFFAYPLTLGIALIVVGAFMQMGALGSVFWIFDLTGILGDVMSYSRLAGVGLATFYLASSFNLLSKWVSATVESAIPGFIGAAIALAIGVVLLVMFHVFNLLLSSLAAFIHSLRLCFVEFLLKFYEGGGRAYAPFHLRLRREVTVGKKS
ncbi:MAG: hypothetical protein JW736_03485 [Deltaproteobacteria bacterium]|nr:hypothetical protein [Deltaproteobacteria bacterium]